MFKVIDNHNHNQGDFKELLDSFYLERTRVFIKGLGWPLRTINGREIDQYDTKDAHYVVISELNEVVGGFRLSPTTSPYMIKEIFPHLVHEDISLPSSQDIWELTRFCYDKKRGKAQIKHMTSYVFLAILELALKNKVKTLLTHTNVSLGKLMKKSGWDIEHIGPIKDFHGKPYVIATLPVNDNTYRAMQEKAKLSEKLLS